MASGLDLGKKVVQFLFGEQARAPVAVKDGFPRIGQRFQARGGALGLDGAVISMAAICLAVALKLKSRIEITSRARPAS